MTDDFPDRWMWSEACEMLARAERMHRQFFQPVRSLSGQPAWEPPADVLESERDVLVVVALPGSAVIHRLELPQGRFERRLALPGGRYSDIRRKFSDGCLLVLLTKSEPFRG